MDWDVFISYASADKQAVARPLAEALQARELRVWFDDFVLQIGDSISRSIDAGLARSRHGVVVISPAFFSRHWPQAELGGLFQRAHEGKVILPVWFDIDHETVCKHSPLLADLKAAKWSNGLESVVASICAAVSGSPPAAGGSPPPDPFAQIEIAGAEHRPEAVRRLILDALASGPRSQLSILRHVTDRKVFVHPSVFVDELARMRTEGLIAYQEPLVPITLVGRVGETSPPFDEPTASQYARSVVGGHVVRAIPYRNRDSFHAFIAVHWRSAAREFDDRIAILEQFGNSFRRIWTSDRLSSLRDFRAMDINEDGIKEIIFVEESMGSGGGTKVLSVFVPATTQLYQVTEIYDWSDAAGPATPQIAFSPDPDPGLAQALEKLALEFGLLQMLVVDFDDPKFAVQAWHADNGQRTEGEVTLRHYAGPPQYGSSPTVTAQADDVTYTAFFKGPVCGYLKEHDQHFVAFSPAWTYDWASWIVHDGAHLWFPYKEWFLTFELQGEHGILRRYDRCPPSIQRAADRLT